MNPFHHLSPVVSNDCVLNRYHCCVGYCARFCSFSKKISRKLELFLSLSVKSGQVSTQDDLLYFQ